MGRSGRGAGRRAADVNIQAEGRGGRAASSVHFVHQFSESMQDAAHAHPTSEARCLVSGGRE